MRLQITVKEVTKFMHRQGVCPKCNSSNLNYNDSGVEDEQFYYGWDCADCEASGKEWYALIFEEHTVETK